MAKRKNKEENIEPNIEQKINQANEEIISKICACIPGAQIIKPENELGYISTGNLAIDFICSGKFWGGGIPMGRITEIYGSSSTGKTVVGTHIIQCVQKVGGVGILIDSESAYSASFGETLGLDTSKLIYLQPECLEDSFTRIVQIIQHIRDNTSDMRPIAIVYDSIAASPSRREIQKVKAGEDIGSSMGHRALICSDYLRNIASFLAKQKAAVIVINQIREKIGVMFGCFQYDSRIELENGKTEKIGKIVNQKLPVKIKSYNFETGKIEYKSIKNWYDNGNANYFLQFKVEKPYGNGRSQFGVTENHLIYTPDGEIQAVDLQKGDFIYGRAETFLSPTQKSIVIGSVLGDGSLRLFKNNYSCSLRIGHGEKQIEYCKWKQSLFGNIPTSSRTNSKQGWTFETAPYVEFKEIKDISYNNNKKIITKRLSKQIDKIALAIWYMDDGTFDGTYKKNVNGKAEISCPTYSSIELELLADAIERLGIKRPICKEGKGLRWDSEGTKSLHLSICDYIHPSMNYKIHPKIRKNKVKCLVDFEPKGFKLIPVKILDIYEKPETKSMRKFDIEIADNHNYFVDGVLVHNSPETTAGGGRSLEFYCSIRLNCKGRGRITDKQKRVHGIQMDVINTKNKCSSPFRVASGLELFFNQGISPTSGLIKLLVEEEKLIQGGGWYSINDGSDDPTKFREKNLVNVLLDHPELVEAPSREALEEYLGNNRQSLEASLSDDITIEGEDGNDQE